MVCTRILRRIVSLPSRDAVQDEPKTQSRTMSVVLRARLKATICASGAMGKEETEDGGGAMRGSPRFSHCFLSRWSTVRGRERSLWDISRRNRTDCVVRIASFL